MKLYDNVRSDLRLEDIELNNNKIYNLHDKVEILENQFRNWLDENLELYPDNSEETPEVKLGMMLEDVWMKLYDAKDALLDATTIIEEWEEEIQSF